MKYYDKSILEQRYILRILWMIPIYAIDCMIATWIPSMTEYVCLTSSLRLIYAHKHNTQLLQHQHSYIDPLRDCYEAYVLYSFVCLLEAYLRLESREDLNTRFKDLPPVKPLFPFNLFCSKPYVVDEHFFYKMETGVIQYMVLKPFLALIQLILTACEVYKGGLFDFTRGYAWILLFTNLSQTWALYCLVYVHLALHHVNELKPKRLLGKFLVIKAVVFFAFWQSCLFALLIVVNVIQDTDDMEADVRAAAIDDFILCVEMVFIAWIHRDVFTYLPYRKRLEPVRHAMKMGIDQSDEYKEMTPDELTRQASTERKNRGRKRDAMMDIVNVKDVVSDIQEHLLKGESSDEDDNDGDGADEKKDEGYVPPAPRSKSIEIDD